MTLLTEGKHAGEFIVSEASVGSAGVSRSRDTGIVVSGQNLVAGAVVGKITTSGKWAEYDPAAIDGSENAAGILFDAVDASAADADGVVLVRDMEFNLSEVTWKTAMAQNDIDAGVAALAALGMIAR